MDKEYVSTIICNGKHYVIVEMKNAAHVMPADEWKRIYGKLHPEMWENGKRVRSRRHRKLA